MFTVFCISLTFHSKKTCQCSMLWHANYALFCSHFCHLLVFHVEKAMAPYSSILAWKIPWTEEPGGLQSMGLLRVRHDWATSLSLFTFMHWRGKGQPTPVFLPGESQGWGAWWAAVYGDTQSWTRLKWRSSSSLPWPPSPHPWKYQIFNIA